MKRRGLVWFLLLSLNITAQRNALTDSMESVLKTQSADTSKVKTLNELAWEYSSLDLKKGKEYARQSIAISTRLQYIKGRSSAYNTLGNICSDLGDNKEALTNYFLALKDKQTTKDKKGEATVCSNIGIVYRILSDSANSLRYYRMALHARELLNDSKGIGDCYNNMGNVYRDYAQYDLAMQAFGRALSIRQSLKDNRGVAFTYNNMATVYDDKFDVLKSLEYQYKAAKLLEEIQDDNSLARTYDNISILNKKLKNFREALKYGTLALGKAEKTGNRTYEINIYSSLGDIFVEQRQFLQAEINFRKGLKLALAAGVKEQQAHFYAGLGLCMEAGNFPVSADSNYQAAVKLVNETGSERDQVRYANILADFDCRQKKTETLALLERAIEKEEKNGYKDELKKSYKTLGAYYETIDRNMPMALLYYKRYGSMNDSLYSENVSIKFAEQQTRYESDKQEREIRIMSQQEEINTLQLKEKNLELLKRNYLLLASGALIVALFVLGYYYFSRQRIKALRLKEKAIRDTEEKERMRLAKDIHDDLGSGLTKIKFLTEVIGSRSKSDTEVQTSIKSIADTSVSLVDNMRDLIWALNPDNTTLGSLVARIREYATDYLQELPIDLELEIPDTIPEIPIAKEAHRNLFFIVKEGLHNIAKHSGAGKVVLKISLVGDNFRLTLADNGSLSGKSPKEGGNGLRNIRQRMELIGGTGEIQFEATGVTVSVQVQLYKIERK
ncbi:MAG: tetratricopeptide repeat protein [Bacteroidia bacterium]